VGKHLLHLKVTRVDGRPLGVGRALVRTALELWFPMLLGAWILSTESLVALHEAVSSLAGFEGAKRLVLPLIVSHLALSVLYAAGFLVAIVRRDKRTLHDLAAGSIVRYRLSE
jgi:uncharacterized RDD family membrane protein YckC